MGGKLTVAIDGPAGAGKSTVARELARKLGYKYIDSGAAYRAVTLLVLESSVAPDKEDEVDRVLKDASIALVHGDNGQVDVLLNGRDVSKHIRTERVSRAVSTVSAHRTVRDTLNELFRGEAQSGGVVMDGRDIGTVVLPNADVKIFLTATVQKRAERRYLELQQKGAAVSYDDVLNAVAARDEQDASRAIAPMGKAADAVVLDTTGLTVDEAVNRMMAIVKKAGE